MVETEMSLSTSYNLSNSISSYSKIETQENYLIDPKDITLGIYSKDQKDINISTSDQLLPISIEEKKSYFYKKIGNCFSFFGDIYGDPKIIIGPHWPLYVIVVFSFTITITIIYVKFGDYIYLYKKIIGIILYLAFLASYSYTVLINPGYPKHDIDSITGEPRKKFYFCNKCLMWVSREKKTRHCYFCNICIEGHDHHCPWTGKCIGKYNFVSFIIFLICVILLIFYFMLMVMTMNKISITNGNGKK